MSRRHIERPQAPNLIGKSPQSEKQSTGHLTSRPSFSEVTQSNYDASQIKKPLTDLSRAMNLQTVELKSVLSSQVRLMEEMKRGIDQLKSAFVDFSKDNRRQTTDTETIRAIVSVEVEKRLKEILTPYVTKGEVDTVLNSTYMSTSRMSDSFNKAMDDFYHRMGKIEEEVESLKDLQIRVGLMTAGIAGLEQDEERKSEVSSSQSEENESRNEWEERRFDLERESSQDRFIEVESRSVSPSPHIQNHEERLLLGDEHLIREAEKESEESGHESMVQNVTVDEQQVSLETTSQSIVEVEKNQSDSEDDEKREEAKTPIRVHAEFSGHVMKVTLKEARIGTTFRVYGTKRRFCPSIFEATAKSIGNPFAEPTSCLIQAFHSKGMNLLKLVSTEDRSGQIWEISIEYGMEMEGK